MVVKKSSSDKIVVRMSSKYQVVFAQAYYEEWIPIDDDVVPHHFWAPVPRNVIEKVRPMFAVSNFEEIKEQEVSSVFKSEPLAERPDAHVDTTPVGYFFRSLFAGPEDQFVTVRIEARETEVSEGGNIFEMVERIETKAISTREACFLTIENDSEQRAIQLWGEEQVSRWRKRNDEQIPVRINYFLKRDIETAAKKLECSMSDFIRDACESYLEQLKNSSLSIHEKLIDEIKM